MGRKKRILESDSERVSPPSKMTKGRDDEILAKLNSFDVRFDQIGGRFDLLESKVDVISKALQEIEDLKVEVKAMKDSVEGYQRLEIHAKKRSVLIRGLKFESKKQFETRFETRKALAGFFERIDFQPHLVDYQRLGGLKKDGDGAKIAVRVEFSDVDQRFVLFEKLKEMGKELSDITILTDFPQFQMQQFKALSTAGYNLWKSTPGIKTRMVPKGLGLVLQKRSDATDTWTAA